MNGPLIRFHVRFMVVYQTVASSLLATTTVWVWSRLPGGNLTANTARFSRGLCMFFLTVSHAILGCVSLEHPNHDLRIQCHSSHHATKEPLISC